MAQLAIIETHDGRQLAAARALADLGIRELAAAAGVTVRTLHRLETGGLIQVAEKKRHGCVQRDLWLQIVAALASAGVELLPQGASFGGGVRWTTPRERRPVPTKEKPAPGSQIASREP